MEEISDEKGRSVPDEEDGLDSRSRRAGRADSGSADDALGHDVPMQEKCPPVEYPARKEVASAAGKKAAAKRNRSVMLWMLVSSWQVLTLESDGQSEGITR